MVFSKNEKSQFLSNFMGHGISISFARLKNKQTGIVKKWLALLPHKVLNFSSALTFVSR